jgi:hypothetical protein
VVQCPGVRVLRYRTRTHNERSLVTALVLVLAAIVGLIAWARFAASLCTGLRFGDELVLALTIFSNKLGVPSLARWITGGVQ